MGLKFVIPICIAIIGAALAGYFAMDRELWIKKNEVYMQIIGMKKWMKQVHLSRAEAFLYSDYHEERWRLQGYKNAIDMEEARRQQARSEDLAMDAAKAEQRLAEIVGGIRCYFKLSKSETDLVDSLLSHSVPSIQRLVGEFDTIEKLDEVKDKASNDLQRLVEIVFDETFDPVDSVLKSKL